MAFEEVNKYKSELSDGPDRFLSQAIAHCLADNWRTPEDFLRHFKPHVIMEGLANAPDLRAQLLVEAAGVHKRIATKKSTESATEDLQIALDEGITTPAAVLDMFGADDRVRYLDRRKLWVFLTEDEFWTNQDERSAARMAFMLENALAENLLTLQDISDGISFQTVADRLPPDELRKVVRHALEEGRRGAPLNEESLLRVVALAKLVGYMPLAQVWNGTIVEKVARPHQLEDAPAAAASEHPPALSQPEAAPTTPPPAQAAKSKGKVKPPPEPAPPSAPPESLADVDDNDSEDETRMVSSVSPGQLAGAGGAGERTPQEGEARRKVSAKLEAIDRLPPNHELLATPILLSIESMYAELLICSDDESREMCIRDSFPNETHLRTALLALIELLDPSIDVNDSLIREAEIDSLIKVVLFEERHRYEQQTRGKPAASPSPPVSGRKVTPPPPPLPRPGAGDAKRAR
jgi:hypothetical protein